MFREIRLVWELVRLNSIAVEFEAALEVVVGPEFAGLSVCRFITPGEDALPVRQIVIKFEQPLVSFCRKTRIASEIPIKANEALDCQWRWLTTSSLACRLDQGRMRAVDSHRTLSIAVASTASNGEHFNKSMTHCFSPQQPDVRWLSLLSWDSTVCPVFRLVFNQDVSSDTLPSPVDLIHEAQSERRIGGGFARLPPIWLSSR